MSGLMERWVAVSAAGLWSSPRAVRLLDAPALARPVQLREWVAAQGPAERRDLWGRLETQVLLGERVRVREVSDGWAHVVAPAQPSRKDPLGYPGWMPVSQLAEAPRFTGTKLVVTVPVTSLLDGPGGNVLLDDVSLATILPAGRRREGFAEVHLPGGGSGWIAERDVDLWEPASPLPTARQIIELGHRFLGTTYVAAGVHGLALDCSGLVHLIYRRYGHTVPRDAKDQALLGHHVDITDFAAGDLAIFQNADTGDVYHVGICDGMPSVLHVSQTDWTCLNGPLSLVRRSHLVAGRRYHLPERLVVEDTPV